MDTINNIELRDENIYPNEKVLQSIIGETYGTYEDLLKLFEKSGMIYEWRYYKDGKAWLCKVQKQKRTIVWMSAWKGYMQATIYLPEQMVDELINLDLTVECKKKIQTTKNVGKSKPCIFEIREKKVLDDFEKVMNFKIKNK